MILKMLTDVGIVHDNVDSETGEVATAPDPGQHQQLRGVVGASREDDLSLHADGVPRSVLAVLDTHGALPLEDHPMNQRPGFHRQVAASEGWPQIPPSG